MLSTSKSPLKSEDTIVPAVNYRVVQRDQSSSKVQRPPIKHRFLTPWCSVYALFFLRVAAALAAVARRLRVAAALRPAARRFRV